MSRWSLCLVFAVGCGDKEDSAATDDSSGDSDVTERCVTLEETDCGEDTGCMSVQGRELQIDEGGGLCVDFTQESQFKGCIEAAGCGDAETLGASAEDPELCWWFPSTCLPAGWSGCELSGGYGECSG